MKTIVKHNSKLILLLLISMLLYSCSTVPITGRKQFNVVPNSQMIQLGAEGYASFLSSNPAINPPTVQSIEVSTVGQNISRAVTQYMNLNNLSHLIEGYNWEFNTVQSNEINAWCMPGGKIVVYTGILPITEDAAGLAVVIGHEVAHAVARHSNERMSQQLAIQLGGMTLATAMQQKPQQTQNIFLSLYGIGSQLGAMAYSRKQEYEADKLGLIFMAMAGYNPQRAVSFWTKMANSSTGTKPPEFLSTHPSDANRISEIQKFLPEAMKYYTGSSTQPTSTPNTGTGTATPKPPQKYNIKIK